VGICVIDASGSVAALVNSSMKGREFSFSRRTLLHGVSYNLLDNGVARFWI